MKFRASEPTTRAPLFARLIPLRGLPFAVDPWIVLPAITILLFSLAALYSVVYHPIAFEINPELASEIATPFTKHLLWGLMGIAGMTAIALLRPTELHAVAGRTYFIALAVLVATLLVGVKVRNIRAWLSLGIVTFQPAELVKVALVLALAKYLSNPEKRSRPIRTLFGSALIVGIPAALVLKQPDMGTVIVFLSILLTMPFMAGLPSRYLVLIVISSTLAISRLLVGIADEHLSILPQGVLRILVTTPQPAMVICAALAFLGTITAITMLKLRARNALSVWLFAVVPPGAFLASFALAGYLKEYQKLRLLTFLAPQLDPKGSGYNIIQSQIAFGSGGLAGRGFRGATQSALGFLPERQTDFIFSVIGEVFGFAGVTIVILAFVILCLRILWIGSQSANRFGGLVCTGFATIITAHVVVNMGMVIGIMPIMGIPLPLASYGGTAMLATFLMLGIVLGVEREMRVVPARERRAFYRPGAELEHLNAADISRS